METSDVRFMGFGHKTLTVSDIDRAFERAREEP